MNEPEAFEGEVWIPGRFEDAARAAIRFDPGGGTWVSIFDSRWAADHEGMREWPVLLGQVRGNSWPSGRFSLFEVRRWRWEGSEPTTMAEASAAMLVKGRHVESPEELKATGVRAGFRGAAEWLSAQTGGPSSPLSPTQNSLNDGHIYFEVDDTAVHFMLSRHESGGRFRQVVETRGSIQLSSPAERALPEWQTDWIDPIRDLVLFGTREHSVTTFVTLSRKDLREQAEIFTYAETAIPTKSTAYHQRDLLAAGATDDFPALVRSWLFLHRRLGGAGSFFFATLNATNVPLENRFLNLLAFAEAYQRQLHDKPPIAKSADTRYRRAMLETVSDEAARKVYRESLMFANRQTQRERLQWLFERVGACYPSLGAIADDVVDRLIATRNWMTHWSRKSNKVLDGRLLDRATAILTLVLEGNILLDLGLNESAVALQLGRGYVWDNPVPGW